MISSRSSILKNKRVSRTSEFISHAPPGLPAVEIVTTLNCIVLEIKYDGTHGIHPERTLLLWEHRFFRLNTSDTSKHQMQHSYQSLTHGSGKRGRGEAHPQGKRPTTSKPGADMQLQKGKWERAAMMDAPLHKDLSASAFYLPLPGLIPEGLLISTHRAVKSLQAEGNNLMDQWFSNHGF